MKKLIALTLAVAFTASLIHAAGPAPEAPTEQEQRIESKLDMLKAQLKELATKKFWKDLWEEHIWTKKHWKRNAGIAAGTLYASMLGNAYANNDVQGKDLGWFGKLSRRGTPNWGPFGYRPGKASLPSVPSTPQRCHAMLQEFRSNFESGNDLKALEEAVRSFTVNPTLTISEQNSFRPLLDDIVRKRGESASTTSPSLPSYDESQLTALTKFANTSRHSPGYKQGMTNLIAHLKEFPQAIIPFTTKFATTGWGQTALSKARS